MRTTTQGWRLTGLTFWVGVTQPMLTKRSTLSNSDPISQVDLVKIFRIPDVTQPRVDLSLKRVTQPRGLTCVGIWGCDPTTWVDPFILIIIIWYIFYYIITRTWLLWFIYLTMYIHYEYITILVPYIYTYIHVVGSSIIILILL